MTDPTRTIADHALRAAGSEVHRFRSSLRELVLLAVVGGIALALALIGLLIAAFGAYGALVATHGPLEAGLIVGCGLMGVGLVVVLVAMIIVGMQRRRRRLEHLMARRALQSDMQILRTLAGLGSSQGGGVPVIPLIALAAGVAAAFLGKRKD
ncbi:MAG: phage holin family protein [Rhodospirillaceae bacterium]|nr:phage holin family protein [Rhodospirillaceae bacterium]